MKSKVRHRTMEAHMTNRDLARRLGVTENTVWRWNTDEGVGSLSLRRAAQVAEVLGCRVSDLYEED